MISWEILLSQSEFVKDSGLSTFWYKNDNNVQSVQASACLKEVQGAHHLPIYFFPIVWILEACIKLFSMNIRKFLHFVWPCWTLQHWLLNTPAEKKPLNLTNYLFVVSCFFPAPPSNLTQPVELHFSPPLLTWNEVITFIWIFTTDLVIISVY